MALISFIDVQLTLPPTVLFDPSTQAGDTIFVSAGSTLVAQTASPVPFSMFNMFHDDLTYLLNGETFGSLSAYADNLSIIIGETGYHTEDLYMALGQLSLTNHGTMQATSNSLIQKFTDPALSNTLTIYNTGNMYGVANGEYPGKGLIDSAALHTVITNFGFIGGTDLAIHTYDTASDDGDTFIENYGIIDGDVDVNTSTDDRIENYGSILGDVSMGDGNDVYRGSGEVTGTINGDNGNDTILGGAGGDEILGGFGIDRLNGRGGDDVIDGGSQNDVIHGNAGDDNIIGGGGQDNLFGDAGDDTMDGGFGNDTMLGGAGRDSMNGGGGNDRLTGGLGDDDLTGGAGNDTFVMTRHSGNDTITDFADGADRIDISAFGILIGDFATEVAPGLSGIPGGSTLLDLSALGGTGSVVIEGVALADITAADFIF
ncbi:calcium-binding protein [Phaeobacter marinintestinus]|uniref:calcium-binding protein n=1 Tax=Falsiphaeobacter marinintestinus TaxID=1492905 RepID=UPI001FE8BC33|nr:calcium-binding protein [Phaeobacter marinintestinus]